MPSSILDIGLGNGKMGFIARDFLDVMLGERHRKEDWQVRIDGIEVFPDYIQEHQRAIYDDIYIGDAFEVIDRLADYDLIILGDVLEHLKKEKAWQFLDKCAAHCNSYLILNIPLGEKWTQPAVYGNPYEEHISFWDHEEFKSFIIEKELFCFPGIGDYGCLLIKKDDYIHYRIRERADALYSEGRAEEAISYMFASLYEIAPDLKSEYVLVDFLLKELRIKNAIERLKGVVDVFPEEMSVRHYLETLREIVAKKDAK
jgi:tetratricopeptide (TPR) repeat protein